MVKLIGLHVGQPSTLCISLHARNVAVGHLLGNVNIADSTALKASLIASIGGASETVISVLGVLDGVENVWSL